MCHYNYEKSLLFSDLVYFPLKVQVEYRDVSDVMRWGLLLFSKTLKGSPRRRMIRLLEKTRGHSSAEAHLLIYLTSIVKSMLLPVI